MPEGYTQPAPEHSPQPARPPKLIWTDANALAAWEKTIQRACRDRGFREFCTGSSDNAKRALSEEGNIIVPDRLRILFLDSSPDVNCAVVVLPAFQPENRDRQPVDLGKQLVCCGYHPYVT